MRPLVALLAVVALLSLTGCSSGGKNYEGGMKTASNLQSAADRVQKAQTQVDQTLALADTLVNQPQSDPRKQFAQYRKSLAELESTIEEVRDKAADMRKRGDSYFAQWEKDIAKMNNEDIKKVTAERRAQRMAQFQKVQQSYQEVADAAKPFMADLRDIDRALSAELTAGNLEAMKPFVAKAKNNKVAMRNASDALIQQFRELGVQMSPTAGKS
jgi:hypothetical protein